MAQKYGNFTWRCPRCLKEFHKDTPQGLGLAKENHLRKHAIPIHHVDYIQRDYDQYPEDICGDMCGDCKNCPLPENMRGECVEAHLGEKGIDTGKRP